MDKTKFILKVKRIFNKVYKIVKEVLRWATILPIVIEYIIKLYEKTKGE